MPENGAKLSEYTTVEVLVFKKYQFIFMSHVLINYYRPKTNTGEVEFNLIDI